MELNQILVIVEPNDEHTPLVVMERAQWLVRQHQVKVHLLVCEYNSALDGGFFFDGPAQQKARDSLLANRVRWLEKLAAPLRALGTEVTTAARWGKPRSGQILEQVRDTKPDLILIESHMQGLFDRLFFSNVSWQLVRQCDTPLWLVRQKSWQGNRLATALDPLHASDTRAGLDHRLIRTSQCLAQVLRLQTDFVHSLAPLPRHLLFDNDLMDAYDQYLEQHLNRHANAFHALLDSYDIPAGNRHLLEGFPEQSVSDFVNNHNCSLLVMGSISRSNLGGMLIGNTAERLLENSQCDVLVVRPPLPES